MPSAWTSGSIESQIATIASAASRSRHQLDRDGPGVFPLRVDEPRQRDLRHAIATDREACDAPCTLPHGQDLAGREARDVVEAEVIGTELTEQEAAGFARGEYNVLIRHDPPRGLSTAAPSIARRAAARRCARERPRAAWSSAHHFKRFRRSG